MTQKLIERSVLIFILFNLSHSAFSQKSDSTKVAGHFGGAVTVTNNGISFIPSFTLGKPAAIFDLSAGRKRLSFEPQFRFALEGKPWSFIFWWRYKLLQKDKFQINLGAHPAFAFKTVSDTIDETTKETIVVQRFLAGEVFPNYSLTKNINFGIYYFYGYGVEKVGLKNTHMVSFRSNISSIGLSDKFYMKVAPQVYYLRIDQTDGFYFSASLSLAIRDFPLSASSIINIPIQTDIPSGDDFLWNISLIYSFNKEYIEQ